MEQVGWFSKIKNAFGSLVFGIILFLVAFPLIWWNEGRAVREATGIAAGQKAVHSVSADKLDPGNEGKLIHVSGEATSKQPLQDPFTGLSASVLRLRRQVEIYQWREKKNTRTRKKLGGGEEKVTTYEYEKTWVDEPISSAAFKEKEGHTNSGSLPCKDESFESRDARLGAFALGPATARLSHFESWTLPQDKGELPDGFKAEGGTLFRGANPASPTIGDVRIQYEVVKPGPVTVVAAQTGDSFSGYMAAQKEIFEVRQGQLTSDQIFSQLQSTNSAITWVLRFVGFLCMFIGVAMLFSPIAAVADFIPFFGGLVEGGAMLVALTIAIPATLFTVGLAWVAHRPLLGVGLLVIGAVVLFGVSGKLRKK